MASEPSPTLTNITMTELEADHSTVVQGDIVGYKISKNPDFYFQDGNIVLLSKDKMAFRLYRGQLGHYSEIFADMLNIGELNKAETFDNCPLVTLQDSSADMTSLFSLLWRIAPENPSFDFVAGALRMSSKYFFKGVREWCITRLRSVLPHTYKEFRTDFALAKYYKSGWAPHKIIQLAYDHDLPFLLPLAYYKLSSCAEWSKQERHIVEQYIEPLQSNILVRLLLGRETLQNMWITFIASSPVLGWDSSQQPGSHTLPASKTPCRAGSLFPSLAAYQLSLGMTSPLVALVSAKSEYEKFVCTQCNQTLDKDIEAFGKLIYESLPKIFELPPPPPPTIKA